jgi:hypothetical protein
MAMTVRTNVANDGGKKKKTKTETTPGKTTEVTIKAATPASTTPGSKSYVKSDERTGAPSYGKESKTKPTPDFVKKAQEKGQNFAEQDGKKYRAGSAGPGKIARDIAAKPAIKVKLPSLPTTREVPVKEAVAKRKIKRLKPMAMTYGTVDKSGRGGTKYKNKVRSR